MPIIFIAFVFLLIAIVTTCISIYYHILYKKSKKVLDADISIKKKWFKLNILFIVLSLIFLSISIILLYPSTDNPRIDTEEVKFSNDEKINNNILLIFVLLNVFMYLISSNILDKILKKNNVFNLSELEKIILKVVAVLRTNIVFTINTIIVLSLKIIFEIIL